MRKKLLTLLLVIVMIANIGINVGADNRSKHKSVAELEYLTTPGPLITAGPLEEPTEGRPQVLPAEFLVAGKKYSNGDRIYFGNYWQNDTNGDGIANKDDTKEPIVWRVLFQYEDDLFLMSEKGLDCQPYNFADTAVTWETCTLRSWLNETFYENAFSDSERMAITVTTLENLDTKFYNGVTEGGNNTNDKVFLLSYDDVRSSYGDNLIRDKMCVKTTRFAKDSGANVYAYWWLRSPGLTNSRASYFHGLDNKVELLGQRVDCKEYAVVPALHLDLNSIDKFTTPTATYEPTSSATPQVYPSATPSVRVKKSIKFVRKSVKVKKGKKVSLKVEITGAKKATFTVDKKGKKIVKLFKKKAKSVIVKGRKKGRAIVTAKISSKRATCKVTVK